MLLEGGPVLRDGRTIHGIVQCYCASEEETEMVQAEGWITEKKNEDNIFKEAAERSRADLYVAVGWGNEAKREEEEAKCRTWRVESTRLPGLLGGCSGRRFFFSEKMQHPGSSPRSKFLEYKTFVQDDASFSRRYFVPPNPTLAGNGVPISLRHHTDNVTAVRWVGENSCLTCGIDSSLCKWDLSEVLRQSSAGESGSANEDRTDHRADKEPSIFKPKLDYEEAPLTSTLPPSIVIPEAHPEGVYCVDLVDKLVATGASGKGSETLKLWSADSLDELQDLHTRSAVYAVKFRDPGFLVAGTKCGSCMFFDPTAGRQCLSGGKSHIFKHIHNSDLVQRFFLENAGRYVTSHPLKCPVSQFSGLHKSVLQSLDLSETHGVLTGGSDGKIYLVDPRVQSAENSSFSFVSVEKTAIYAVRWCANPNYFLSSGDNYCISRWDVRKMSTVARRRGGEQSVVTNYFGHSSDVRCLEMLGDDFFVSGTADGSLRIWPVDEIGAIEDSLITNDFAIEKAENERSENDLNVVAHAHTDHGRRRVQKNVETLHALYDRTFELQEIYSEKRSALQCLQATYQLDAHSSLVCGLSAKRCPATGHWRILTSSADQTVKLFQLGRKLDKNHHVRWVTQYHVNHPVLPSYGMGAGGGPARDTQVAHGGLMTRRHDSLTRVH
eukprot:g1682.t1